MAFGVKQKRPKTIDEVVSATLEMESYITQPTSHSGTAAAASIATGYIETESPATVAAADMTERLTTLVERLTERVEQLELKYVQGSGTGEKREVFPYRGRSRGRGRGGAGGESWNSQGSQRSFVGHGQADEGGKNMACNHSIIATSHNIPTGGYRIEAIVNGIETSLLLDTGAAVSLIREDAWLHGKDNKSGELQPWTQHNLVSVDSSPLHIHGYTTATVELGGAELQVGMVVVSPLTTEAILGLDFLSKHRANIDLRKEEVRLDSCPRVLKLTSKTTARVKEDTTVPSNSQAEVLACIHGPVDDRTWLLEDLGATIQQKQRSVMVARSLVTPGNREVPVRILNPHNSPITIFKYTTIAMLEPLDKLQDFNFRIQHKQGRSHTNADALSQLPCQQCGRASYQQSTEAADSTPPENIEQLQQDDPHIGPILKAKIIY